MVFQIEASSKASRRERGGAKMTENEIGTQVVDTAIHLHKNLGPGLLESVYEAILMKLLAKKGFSVQRQTA